MKFSRHHGIIFFLIIILLVIFFLIVPRTYSQQQNTPIHPLTIKLPRPALSSDTSIEEALSNRRSIRDYSPAPLTLKEVAQLLWAAQGITSPQGFRTAPSAGALYPLEIYIVTANVIGLPPGVYHYDAINHALQKITNGDMRTALAKAAFGQKWVQAAPADIVITAIFARTTKKYHARGDRYVYMEAGHAAENICLQTIPLHIGTVTVGGFDDNQVNQILGTPNNVPLYVMPIGKWVTH